jgi:hypothetical protein
MIGDAFENPSESRRNPYGQNGVARESQKRTGKIRHQQNRFSIEPIRQDPANWPHNEIGKRPHSQGQAYGQAGCCEGRSSLSNATLLNQSPNPLMRLADNKRR